MVMTFQELAAKAVQALDDSALAADWLAKAYWLDVAEGGPSNKGFRAGAYAVSLYAMAHKAAPALDLALDLRRRGEDGWHDFADGDRCALLWGETQLRLKGLLPLGDAAGLCERLAACGKGGKALGLHARGQLAAARGGWDAALRLWEEAYAAYEPNGGLLCRQHIAYAAATVCLRLGRPEDGRRWMAANSCDDQACDVKTKQRSRFACLLSLRSESLETAAEAAGRLVESDPDNVLHRAWASRPLALDLAGHGDPGALGHPARGHLRYRATERLAANDRWERQLAVVDYRLNTLAYALGRPLQADHWTCQRVNAGSPGLPPETARRRAAAARRSLTVAAGLADRLNEAYGCNWRRGELAQRHRWYEALTAPIPAPTR